MTKRLLLNLTFNISIAIIFVFFNNRALQLGLEETFVSLAVIYGIITIIGNAFFIALPKK